MTGRDLRVTYLPGGRMVYVTPVFDTYWRFAAKRQQMYFDRLAGLPPPWTDDPILRDHRFTNVYRASDRVSQYLIRHVQYDWSHDIEDLFFRTILFKIFNREETWKHLQSAVGPIRWKTFDYAKYSAALGAMFVSESIYSAAYIMASPDYGAERKHDNHLRLIQAMMADGMPKLVWRSPSLAHVFNLLCAYKGLGRFLAFQFAIDLNYSPLTNFSEMGFVVPGPGAIDGIMKCFGADPGVSETEIIHAMVHIAPREFARLGLPFHDLWGRPLQPIDCQNLFCEVGKYARVAHPDIVDKSGRTKIKQRYEPSGRPITYWYPPKWGINEKIAPVDLC